MNNKPVAWIKEDTLIYLDNYNYASITIQVQKSKSVGFDIPLYTHPVKEEDEQNWKEMYWQMHELNHKHWSELKAHPVKELTLTDEDILEEWTCKYSDCYQDTLIDFARAILRKAQEK